MKGSWMGKTLRGSLRRGLAGPRGSAFRVVAVISAVLVGAPLVMGMMGPSGGGGGPLLTPNKLRPVQAQKPVPVFAVPRRTVKVPVARPWRTPPVAWPAPSSATVRLPAAVAGAGSAGSGSSAGAAGGAPPLAAGPVDAGRNNALMAGVPSGSVRVGSLPVWAGPAAQASRAATAAADAAAPAAVQVTMASRQAAVAAGVSGVIFTVARSDGRTAAAGVHLSLDYASFAYADGGDYAARLRLVELPGCVLTTPRAARCRVQTPVASADDVATDRLGANVALPAAGASGALGSAPAGAGAPAVVLAATTSSSGSAGDFSATPLSEAGSWAEGGASGAFTYSYPITVPPVPGDLTPEVSLDYNSQTVDGLTSSTNNQASWIGDGWDYEPGYIEQDYQTCSDETSLPSAEQTGDLCWSSSNRVTLTLNGQQTILVDDPSTGWHAQSDSGDRIAYDTGTSNGTHDGDYWVVTDTDGTSYYFGLNELPGYASGDATTNSAWTVPVYATASGQPCYNATFADSHCEQAWRWNLDYVTDSHGDAMAMFYNTETNYYAADKATTATASYIQAGALSKIEYGLRAGSVYGVTPAAEVDFTTATDRTDVPTSTAEGGDLACSSGATCDVQSPTFWQKYRLTTIATETLKGSSLEAVDSWALAQDYPTLKDSTTTPSLWLESITRTGEDGTPVTLPPVTFGPVPLANRVESTADLNDGYSIITRMRLATITNETGGVVTVAYDTPPSSCTSGNFPAPDANTTLCYPDYWSPPDSGSPVEDWFNKYVVTGVTEQNTAGGGVPVQVLYTYSGAAWHYNDNPLTKSKQRTWDQWRGFRTVISETGTAPDPVSETEDIYFQGMDGDYQSNGSTTSVSLTSTEGGDTVTDSNQYAGMNFQEIVYDGAGGAEVSDTVTVPWSLQTGSQSQPSPLPALQSFLTDTGETKVFTPLALGGTRESDTTYTHDSYGRVISMSSVPDTSDLAEDTCTTTSYATNTTSWLLDLPAELTVVSVPCGSSVSLPGDAVSDKRFYYDRSTTLGAAPSAGNVTMTTQVTSYTGTTPVFTTESTATFDEYGRPLTTTDADNRTTTTSYTPATGADPTAETVTDPMGLVTTTTYDPARDLTLSVTTPAGWVTSATYDALGRLTAMWTPGHQQGSVPADETVSYTVINDPPSGSAPGVITTNTITDTGSYLPSETLYDSMGRVIETQDETPDGGRNITDTAYNSDGWKQLVSNSYHTTGAPDDEIADAADDEVPSQTGYVYDGDGRVIQQISYEFATETWETGTAYGGDSTTVSYQAVANSENDLPQAGTAHTTFTNGEGKTSAIYQYHAGVPADPSDPASDYDETTYSYTPAQLLAQITDAAGNQWSHSYNLAGDQTSATDPDAGTSTKTYDAAGQLLTSTDARGKTISYTYDLDGRETAEYDTTGGAAESGSDELASWAYDSLAPGEPTSSTSYVGGTGGSAYTTGVTSYNPYGLPNGTYTTIPASAGALAGTYTQKYAYDAYGDLMASYSDQAAGGLPPEVVNIGYNSADEPVSVGSSLWPYVASLSYTEQGQPQEYAFGTTTEPAWLYDSYNQETNWLTSSEVQTGTTPVTVDATSYSYDMAGDVLSESDTPANGPAQVQCFTYDYLERLTQAWSQGSAGCSSGPSQSAESSAAAPYWDTYLYNNENNLVSQTSTPATGAATTTGFFYPPAGSAQPHSATSQQATGPSGTSTTSYSYNADGDTTSATSSASARSLTWNDAGQLSSVTTTGANAGTTSYVYDADGNLLLQSDPGSTTLYLPDEQLVATTSNGTTTVTGTRYYAIGGVTVAARTSTYSNGGYTNDVQYLISDQQGTATLAIDYATLDPTYRYYDPYGNQIGTAPSSWPGTKGFVGGTADPATGYTNLGAREYNPATTTFISPDPLIDPYDPQDLNAYAYAGDNPATDSDPSGQAMIRGPNCVGSIQACEHSGGGGGGGHSGSGHSGGGSSGGGTNPCDFWLAPAYCSSGANNPAVIVLYQALTNPSELEGPPPPPRVVSTVRNIMIQASRSDTGQISCSQPDQQRICQEASGILGWSKSGPTSNAKKAIALFLNALAPLLGHSHVEAVTTNNSTPPYTATQRYQRNQKGFTGTVPAGAGGAGDPANIVTVMDPGARTEYQITMGQDGQVTYTQQQLPAPQQPPAVEQAPGGDGGDQPCACGPGGDNGGVEEPGDGGDDDVDPLGDL
jgi:RHS repeat-associated protein